MGESRAIQELRAAIARVALSRLPVLINGATGVGKELVVVRAGGRRVGVASPLGNLDPELFELL
ncbi:MAG: sigma 54-interacting transcriptional regulator [Gammaproteobacteria bacterium]